MATRWIAWTCLLLAVGSAGAEDIVPMNQRGIKIPIRIKPERQADVKELLLFVSSDQGKTWELNARATPDKKAFDFLANNDGSYWFTMAVVNAKGEADPRDVYNAPVGQKVEVDTVRPDVQLLSAERVGDEVEVRWEVREARPNWHTLKLDYRVGDAPEWTPVGVHPRERGQARFRPPSGGEVKVRLRLADQAENEGVAERVVPAAPGMMDRSVVGAAAGGPGLRADAPDQAPPTGQVMPPMAKTPGALTAASKPAAPDGPPPPPPATKTELTPPAHAPGAAAPSHGPGPAATDSPPEGPPPARTGALPPLRIVNKRQVKLDFEVSKFGPSGLGGVDVYVTANDGDTWEQVTGDPGVTLPAGEPKGPGPALGSVTVALPRDGVAYGFYLVVKSKAGLGKPPPRGGEPPRIRLEADTTMPKATLFKPKEDLSRPGSLLLAWEAEDRNLTPTPITLEWAADPRGEWLPIGEREMPNTGRYTWQVPEKTPPQVYLRLTVRDTAGNVAVALTDKPVPIDVTVPEVGEIKLAGSP